MIILLFKLIATPIFIGGVTLAGRRWGPAVSGLLMGLPLTSGPVSVFLAVQYGTAFAARAVNGSLVGLVSVCLFCLVYGWTARKLTWPASLAIALATFIAATALWDTFTLSLLPAFLMLLAAILVTQHLMPKGATGATAYNPPRWDLPARIVVATTFVLALTELANRLGPRLSGLIAVLPIYTSVFAAFTHHQQGAEAAAGLLRGVVVGSLAFTAFFLVAGLLLTHLSLMITYLLAALAALTVSVFLFYLPRLTHRP
jgi:hypothetical protein